MAYDRVIAQLNEARLAGTSYPIFRGLKDASIQLSERSPFAEILRVLTDVTAEPPGLPPPSHTGAHLLNAPLFERRFARAYLGRSPVLRAQIARGAREALEAQYWDVLTATVHAHPAQAALGGDPSAANYVRAFVAVRLCPGGTWDSRLELIDGAPLWARLYYLVRTGHIEDALDEAGAHDAVLNARERSFTAYFRAWAESPERRLPRAMRERLASAYNAHVLYSPSTDPFKLALFKLLGRLDPAKRTVPFVTGGVEDWMWFQLAMVDEDEGLGLKELTDVVLGYGERHFEPPKSAVKGIWARVLLLCGAFERVRLIIQYCDTA